MRVCMMDRYSEMLNGTHSIGNRRVEDLIIEDGIVVINPTLSEYPKYVTYVKNESSMKRYGLQVQGKTLSSKPKVGKVGTQVLDMSHIWHYLEMKPGATVQYTPTNSNLRNILVWRETDGTISFRDVNQTEAQRIYKTSKSQDMSNKKGERDILVNRTQNVEKTQCGTYKSVIPCVKYATNGKRKEGMSLSGRLTNTGSSTYVSSRSKQKVMKRSGTYLDNVLSVLCKMKTNANVTSKNNNNSGEVKTKVRTMNNKKRKRSANTGEIKTTSKRPRSEASNKIVRGTDVQTQCRNMTDIVSSTVPSTTSEKPMVDSTIPADDNSFANKPDTPPATSVIDDDVRDLNSSSNIITPDGGNGANPTPLCPRNRNSSPPVRESVSDGGIMDTISDECDGDNVVENVLSGPDDNVEDIIVTNLVDCGRQMEVVGEISSVRDDVYSDDDVKDEKKGGVVRDGGEASKHHKRKKKKKGKKKGKKKKRRNKKKEGTESSSIPTQLHPNLDVKSSKERIESSFIDSSRGNDEIGTCVGDERLLFSDKMITSNDVKVQIKGGSSATKTQEKTISPPPPPPPPLGQTDEYEGKTNDRNSTSLPLMMDASMNDNINAQDDNDSGDHGDDVHDNNIEMVTEATTDYGSSTTTQNVWNKVTNLIDAVDNMTISRRGNAYLNECDRYVNSLKQIIERDDGGKDVYYHLKEQFRLRDITCLNDLRDAIDRLKDVSDVEKQVYCGQIMCTLNMIFYILYDVEKVGDGTMVPVRGTVPIDTRFCSSGKKWLHALYEGMYKVKSDGELLADFEDGGKYEFDLHKYTTKDYAKYRMGDGNDPFIVDKFDSCISILYALYEGYDL